MQGDGSGNRGAARDRIAERDARVGARFTRGTVRVDGGLMIGMTSNDPSFGLTAGFTWVFRGFTVP